MIDTLFILSIVIGIAFLTSLLFLIFLFIKYKLEERFNIEHNDNKNEFIGYLSEVADCSKNEFPIVYEVCHNFIDIIDNNYYYRDKIPPQEFYKILVEKYGDDKK